LPRRERALPLSGQGLSTEAPASSASFRFNARISSKRLVTSRMIATMPIIWPLFCNGTIVNSTEIVAPSLRTAGTESLALPVLPLHVHQGLGLSTFVVGLVSGSQFAASLITRVWAGRFSDVRGVKRAVVTGLLTAVISGLLYVASLAFVGAPLLSVNILLLGRALLGGAESFIITGAVTWGLVLAGPTNAGRVIAWMGMAMFAALAFGAPIGIEHSVAATLSRPQEHPAHGSI
jgi:MFS family permease